jgi:threonine dehydrogenase-like Zn-dependent dehydrogenase
MRALVYNKVLRYEAEYPTPQAPNGDALVRVLKAGVCNTDLELVKGYLGFSGVLGHEFVGMVEGGDYDGQRVAGEINLACGECPTCLAGMPSQCPNRTTLGIDRHDGAFADYLTLPVGNLHPVPDSVSDDAATFVEPLAAALQTLHITHISPHQRVALIGTGKLGLLTAQVIALTGCDLTAISRHDRQTDLLRGWGIDTAQPGEVEARSVDVVVDCTGDEEGFAEALKLVKPRGVIHLKSTYHSLPEADLTRAVVDEVQIHTSRCGPFDAAIRLLAKGAVDVDSLIDARYPLDESMEAMAKASERGVLKVLLEIG